jgi:hypothetical protein
VTRKAAAGQRRGRAQRCAIFSYPYARFALGRNAAASAHSFPAPRSGEGGPRCATAWWKPVARIERQRNPGLAIKLASPPRISLRSIRATTLPWRKPSAPSAPFTALRAVPLPALRGRNKKAFSRRDLRPSCSKIRSPDGAPAKSGAGVQACRPIPDFTSFHPGYETRSKKGGGTPADAIHPLAAPAGAARVHAEKCAQVCAHKIHATRSPVGVPPRLSLRRTNATAQLRLRASWDAALAGVTRRQPVPVQRAPRRPVIVPAGRNPEAARERSANPPAGTAPAPSSGLPPEGVPSERDRFM